MIKSLQINRKKQSVYSYVYALRIEKALAYRFDVFANILLQCIVMFANVCFWRAVYAGEESVGGVTMTQMLTYTVMSSVLAVLFATAVERRVMERVEKGAIAMDLLKPVPLFSIYFYEELGVVTSAAFMHALPIYVIGSLWIGFIHAADNKAFVLFLVSVVLSFLINWLLAAWFSLLAFVTIHMEPLTQVKKHVLRLLSGSIIPIWFFPEWAQKILECLPFLYIYQLPLELFIGRVSGAEVFKKIGLQMAWVIILYSCFRICEKHVQKKLMIQGG
ncbi:MAG: ABC-2 family transporter protein [Eubacterium sp.]|nr:ABC-2 family transporter protein [Eubacterium sp.]